MPVLVVANFTPVPREGYRVGVPFAGRWTEVINSDAALYAGSNYGNSGGAFSEEHAEPWASTVVGVEPATAGGIDLAAGGLICHRGSHAAGASLP